jgi:probable rRNA maturation factor
MASQSKSNIYFFYQTPVALKERTRLKKFIREIFKREKKKLESINYIFCTDTQLLKINREFLKHDYYTDIITFPLSEENAPVEAEVYISIDRIKDNAQQLGESVTNELYRVIFHGALHLCGYRDKSPKEVSKMREKEDYYLSLYKTRFS